MKNFFKLLFNVGKIEIGSKYCFTDNIDGFDTNKSYYIPKQISKTHVLCDYTSHITGKIVGQRSIELRVFRGLYTKVE